MSGEDVRRWLDTLPQGTTGPDRRAVLAWLARAIAAHHDLAVDGGAPSLVRTGPVHAPIAPPPAAMLDPGLLGAAHEALLADSERRQRGAFYTPGPLAAGLVRAAGTLVGPRGRRARVCDPAVGGGVFLLAAARELIARGADPGTVIGEQLWGVDVDPLAVEVATAALALLAAAHGAPRARPRVVVADALRVGLDAWSPRAAPFDLVVGNPPFLGQLRRRTARSRPERTVLRGRLGAAVGPYTDAAALFLATAVEMTVPGGRVALIVPESVLAARDSAAVRAVVAERAALVGLWTAESAGFDAAVRVCAPILAVGRPQPRSVSRFTGAAVEAAAPMAVGDRVAAGASWAPLLAAQRGVPSVELPATPTLASVASATAGFRRQYYGIRPFVRERGAIDVEGPDAEVMPLITAGAIDPARLLWAARPTRFAGRTWTAPVVDLAALRAIDPPLARWAEARRIPKVLVATQTAVVEPVVDPRGWWYPSVPVVSVEPAPERIWEVAAVVGSPVVSAWLATRLAGTALSADTIRVGAAHLLEVPLPLDREAWRDGARRWRDASEAARAGDGVAWERALRAYGDAMVAAYGITDAGLVDWWETRRPPWRAPRD